MIGVAITDFAVSIDDLRTAKKLHLEDWQNREEREIRKHAQTCQFYAAHCKRERLYPTFIAVARARYKSITDALQRMHDRELQPVATYPTHTHPA